MQGQQRTFFRFLGLKNSQLACKRTSDCSKFTPKFQIKFRKLLVPSSNIPKMPEYQWQPMIKVVCGNPACKKYIAWAQQSDELMEILNIYLEDVEIEL